MARRKTANRRRGRRRRSKKSRRDPLARERALDALSRMRSDDLSPTRASRAARTTLRTVRKYAGSALRRSKSGRYRVTPSDRLTRHVWMLTPTGKVEVVVRNSRTASRIAQHSAAVDQYLRTGSTEALDVFRGRSVRARGEVFAFLVDSASLDRLAHAGEVSFERLYVLRT